MDAEAGTGDGGNAGFLQHLVLQLPRAQPRAGDVGEGIERAAGIRATEARQAVEQGYDHTPAFVERRHHLLDVVLRAVERGDAGELRRRVAEPSTIDAWLDAWRQRRTAQSPDGGSLRRINPAFIPRNHRIEAVITAAVRDDYAPFEELNAVLARPYEDQPQFAAYGEPPRPEQRVLQTFCGT